MKIKKSYIIIAVVVVMFAVFIVMGVTRPDPHAGHNHGDTQATVDPHAGHNHGDATTTADPHAGHDHGDATTTADPHAGHDHGDTQTTAKPNAGHNHGDTQTTAKPNADHNQTTAPSKRPTGAALTPDKAYTMENNKNGKYTVSVQGRDGNQLASDTFSSKPTFTEVNQDVLEISDRTSQNGAGHWAKFYDIQNNRTSKTYSFVLATMDHHVAYVDKRSGKFHVFVTDLFDESKYIKGYPLEGAVHTSTGSPAVDYTLNGTELTVTYSTEKGTETIKINMFAE